MMLEQLICSLSYVCLFRDNFHRVAGWSNFKIWQRYSRNTFFKQTKRAGRGANAKSSKRHPAWPITYEKLTTEKSSFQINYNSTNGHDCKVAPSNHLQVYNMEDVTLLSNPCPNPFSLTDNRSG
jgi:hypothetical protein